MAEPKHLFSARSFGLSAIVVAFNRLDAGGAVNSIAPKAVEIDQLPDDETLPLVVGGSIVTKTCGQWAAEKDRGLLVWRRL